MEPKGLVDLPVCSLVFDESLPGILVSWKRYATTEELRSVHEHLLDLIAAHRVTKILGDDTALPTIASSDQRWIVEDWMPRAIRAGLRSVAAKRADGYFGRIAVESIQSVAPPELTLRRFDTITEARDWLTTQGE